MKNKNQPQVQYTVIYLQLTSTFIVRFGAVPIPLYTVQRYFPVISVGFKDKLIPSSQYTTVTAMSIHFGPGDVWCWFTICDTL